MAGNIIFVTGYFGAPILETARRLAYEKTFVYLSLDEEITRRDGRSISRLCMMNGEHGYRNAEYELLKEIADKPEDFMDNENGLVVGCGDGVLYDEMSRDIVKASQLVIVGADLSEDALWQTAKTFSETYHAFMMFGSDEEKREAFASYIARQQKLFALLEK